LGEFSRFACALVVHAFEQPIAVSHGELEGI
jgi:hypothetical protein